MGCLIRVKDVKALFSQFVRAVVNDKFEASHHAFVSLYMRIRLRVELNSTLCAYLASAYMAQFSLACPCSPALGSVVSLNTHVPAEPTIPEAYDLLTISTDYVITNLCLHVLHCSLDFWYVCELHRQASY